jgi:phosphate transport system substrate-binding protein
VAQSGPLSIGVLLAVVSGCAATQSGPPPPSPPERIVISGSTTLQPVVEHWVGEFVRTRSGLKIVVEGGGTDKGFEALLAGTSQIAMAAREISQSERRAFAARKVVVEEFLVARSAIAVFKNKANPVRELEISALRRIFDGSVTNWREVGGPDLPITIILRNPTSTTAEDFRRLVMAPNTLTEHGAVAISGQDVVTQIESAPGAVGFAYFDRVLSQLDTVDVLRIRTGEGPAKLVFLKHLFFYARAPLGDAVKALIAFTNTTAASEIALQQGYFGMKDPI